MSDLITNTNELEEVLNIARSNVVDTSALNTTDKTIVGAINEVNDKTVDKMTYIDTWFNAEAMGVQAENGITWEEQFEITGENVYAQGEISHRVPIMAGENVTFEVDEDNQVVKINADSSFSGSYNDLTDVPEEFNPSEHTHDYIPTSEKGTNNGVATLDENGHVPSTQVPSYVDDVIEGYMTENENSGQRTFYSDAEKTSVITGESGKIYVDLETLRTYRWTGRVANSYAEISESLALGETSTTAFDGLRGKEAYEHSQITNSNPHGVTKEHLNLGNVDNTSDANKPVSTAQATAIADAKQAGTDAQSNLTTHINNKTNPHGVTLAQLGVNASADELNYMDGVTDYIQTQLDGKANKTDIPTIDSALSSTSTNPVQNKVVNTALDGKASKSTTLGGYGITNAYTKTEVDAALNSKVDAATLSSHTTNTNNPHGVTLAQLNVTATATELNYVDGVTSNIQTQLNSKMGDFSIEIYNGTGGNPKPIRFASFNYSTCSSEHGIAAKISLVSGHGNGTSYAFLEDAIIRVSYTGTVEVDNFKYYGAATGTYDGANRQYGDIFWLIDTTNKIVDFYCLMGQYARMYQTPWKRLTYSSGGTVTQHTSCTVYSSGTKVWANNSDIALMSDVPTVAATDGKTAGTLYAKFDNGTLYLGTTPQ